MKILKDTLISKWMKGENPLPNIILDIRNAPSKENLKKKILFLEPRGVKANVFSHAMKYPLLGPLRMTTTMRNSGYNAIMYHENLAKKDISEKILAQSDILILTLLTMTAKRGFYLAELYKKLKPEGKVIIGGIYASFNAEECLKHCDQVVIGEGDHVIMDLIEGKFSEQIVKTENIKDLTKLITPDLKAVVNHRRIRIKPIMTSWGCPFNCSFCCVTAMYGRGYRRFSNEQTIKAIQQYKPRKVFFLDDNLCADKKRSLDLFDRMRKLRKRFFWIAQVRADLAKDEEFVKQMALAGCRRVFIGFESVNQDSLDGVVKNATLDIYKNAARVFHKYGIAIHGMFILGLDSDTRSIFTETINFCKDYGIEAAQFLLITPFSGTRFYEELEENRFITHDTDLYDGNHVIITPKNMSPSELFEGMLYTYQKFYSWWSILRQLFRDIKNMHNERIRSIGYRIRKMLNNFFRSIGFRIIIRRLKWRNRKYRKELRILSKKEAYYVA